VIDVGESLLTVLTHHVVEQCTPFMELLPRYALKEDRRQHKTGWGKVWISVRWESNKIAVNSIHCGKDENKLARGSDSPHRHSCRSNKRQSRASSSGHTSHPSW
jgi:hypothetical protein